MNYDDLKELDDSDLRYDRTHFSEHDGICTLTGMIPIFQVPGWTFFSGKMETLSFTYKNKCPCSQLHRMSYFHNSSQGTELMFSSPAGTDCSLLQGWNCSRLQGRNCSLLQGQNCFLLPRRNCSVLQGQELLTSLETELFPSPGTELFPSPGTELFPSPRTELFSSPGMELLRILGKNRANYVLTEFHITTGI